MIKYEYFEDGKLLITKYTGDIDKETVKSYILHIFNQTNCNNLVKLIADYRDSTILFYPEDLEIIAQTRKKVNVGLLKNHTVFLVDTPRETALCLLISEKYNKGLIPADFCATLNRCIKSLSLDIDQDELARRLKELKFEFVE
ncbi:MAG: hypothetical protein WCJ95_05150 [Mariniphaga sp.]